MRLKRIYTLVIAAILAAAILTGCLWDKEDITGDGSSSSSSSSSGSGGNHDGTNHGGSDEEEGSSSTIPGGETGGEEGGESGGGEDDEETETPQNDYDIATNTFTAVDQDGLEKFAAAINSGENPNANLILAADITLTGEWTPIGDYSYEKRYTGTFDGNGHTIFNLHVQQQSNIYNSGLFGCIGSGGVVKNLSLTDINVSGGLYAGGIAGENYGHIINCTVSGTVSTSGNCAGGVTGKNYDGYVIGCTVSGTVGGSTAWVGGVAGINFGHIIGSWRRAV